MQYNAFMANGRALAFVLAFLVGVVAVQSCSPFGGSGAFQCTDDTSCAGGPGGGRCEQNGFCSFPDSKCDGGEGGGRSYGSESGSLSGVCVGSEPPVDAKLFDDAPAVEVDAPPPDPADICYGDPAGYVRPCFAEAPTATLALTMPINTDDGSPDCSTLVKNSNACVIAAASIAIPAGITVPVTGSRPLVLVAVQTITIDGILDAASRRAKLGPNANPVGGCTAPTPPAARGGGAGGTLGGKGGNGGAGGGNGGGASDPVAITMLRGGCDGGEGKTGMNATGGLAGKGGGAVYLIANVIDVNATGRINASGSGGLAGQAGDAGGGGGGSGGFIGLDAPTITNDGQIFANGGGGGEGSGNQTPGDPGDDPTSVESASGGDGASNGLPGGDGGAGDTAAENGTPAPQDYGAGGGGGGVGVLKVFRGTVNGQVSPPPA